MVLGLSRLFVFCSLMILASCSRDNNTGTNPVDNEGNKIPVEAPLETIEPAPIYPDTGLNLNENDYDLIEVKQIKVFTSTGKNTTTQILVENRYYKSTHERVACDVYYYKNAEKSIESIASENSISIEEVIYQVAKGEAVNLYGGEYNPTEWYAQATFVKYPNACSNSILESELVDYAVHNGLLSTSKYSFEADQVLRDINLEYKKP